MGQPFEVVYSPTTWNAPQGGTPTSFSAPYGGLNTLAPPNIISPAETPAMSNFMFRNKELRSRPNFRSYLPSPDGNPILGVGSFLSKNLVWHTFAFTVNGLYQLIAGAQGLVAQGLTPWARVGGPTLAGNTFVRWRVFQNVLYYTNNNGHVSAWDGAALSPITDVAFLGAGSTGLPPATTTLIGAQYIGELDNHLMLAYTSETPITAGVVGATGSFPQRLRWSNSGFSPFDASGNFGPNLGTAGATFDANVFVNAGQNDFIDVPDILTGIMFIGRVGYLIRQNGITEISPTGNGTAPFDFNHLWASEQGIGNVYSATVAQYGDRGIFISTDNVYLLSTSQLSAIGGGARDAIMADLAATNQPPTAVIVPAMTLGYTYLVYMLYIQLPNGNTRVYVYSIEDGNWAVWTISDSIIGIPSKCWIGDQAITVVSQQIATGGVKSGGGGGGGQSGGSGGGSDNPNPRCFTGDVLVRTEHGWLPISAIKRGLLVSTVSGMRPVGRVLVHAHEGPMCDMGGGDLVTPGHHITKDGNSWQPASSVFPGGAYFKGSVYNLHCEGTSENEHNYELSNGWFAHNAVKAPG